MRVGQLATLWEPGDGVSPALRGEARLVLAITLAATVLAGIATVGSIVVTAPTSELELLRGPVVTLVYGVTWAIARSGHFRLAVFGNMMISCVVLAALPWIGDDLPASMIFSFIGVLIVCSAGVASSRTIWGAVVTTVAFGAVVLLSAALHEAISRMEMIYLAVHVVVGGGMGLALSLVAQRMSAERARIDAKVRSTDRLASLGMLSASVGHEINNPLMFMVQNLEVLSARLKSGDPELSQMAEDALLGASRVRSVVDSLRVVSRGGDADKPVDVMEAARVVERLTAPRVRHSAFSMHYGEGLSGLHVKCRLEQVLLNLVLNAVDAVAEARRSVVEVALRTLNGGVLIDVDDSGPGLSHEQRERIFEPFFTTKGHDGTGLGLAISRQLVEEAGGRLEVSESPLGGARFSVWLPAHALDARAAAVEPEAAPPSVLLVDDEQVVLRAIQRAFQGGCDVAGSGAEALQLIDGRSYRLILCDISMPEMSGLDLYERLAAEQPEMASKVWFISGSDAYDERVEATGRPLLRKPIDLARLRSAVDNELAVSAAAPQPAPVVR